ncbi:hypothetical protein D3C73_470800 [compost metagenome]
MNKLQEIREALEAATTGPWSYDPSGFGGFIIYDHTYFNRHIAAIVTDGVESKEREEANANLIAHAPEYLSYLLQLVETQAKALEFYAERDNYMPMIERVTGTLFSKADEDCGQRARATLGTL